jgi:phospholipase/carboxylesterase
MITRRRFLRVGLGSVLVPSWAGCLHDPLSPEGAGQGNARLTVQPHAPTLTAQVGSTALGLSPFGRDGLLYVPDSYDPAVPAPLLVTLHGATGSAQNWEGFFPACEARAMVMLAIDSRGPTWDRVGGFFGVDVPFVDTALEHVFARCRIDPDRIALAGFSDGASYALSLGPSNGDIFRHLIAFSPGHTKPSEILNGQPRIWISHGMDDSILLEERTRTIIVPTLRGAGYDVTYTAFEGRHEVPARIGSEALDWFLT